MVRRARVATSTELVESLIAVALAVDRLAEQDSPRSERSHTEAWTALLRGSSRIVQRCERGGRSYLVLRVRSSNPVGTGLSEREAQVLARRVQGASFKAIATELGVAVSTAASSFARAKAKLGIGTPAELVRLFSTCGLEGTVSSGRKK